MQVAYIITEDSKLFGLFDAIDMFQDANGLAQSYGLSQPAIKVDLVGMDTKELAYQDLLTVKIDRRLYEVGDCDLVLIPAFNKGNYALYLDKYKDIVVWLVGKYEAGTTLCSLCSGAFLLAETGLLDGKYCTTHWAGKEIFQQMFPQVELISQYILTQDDRLITSGGSTNALLAVLYIIRQHYGPVLAHHMSKLYEIDLDRIDQSQFEIFVPNKSHQDHEILKAQEIIEGNFKTITSLEEVRKETSLGQRQFFRRFKAAVAETPFRYLQKVRIEHAKAFLATNSMTIQEIVYNVGYSELNAFRKVFKSQYRTHSQRVSY